MSLFGNFTFKSERSIFQIGSFYFSNWNFLFFNKFVLKSPVISRHNKLYKFKHVLKNPVNSCHLKKDYNFCKRFPVACVPSTFTFNPWIQSRIMSENKLSIEHQRHQHDNQKLLISSKKGCMLRMLSIIHGFNQENFLMIPKIESSIDKKHYSKKWMIILCTQYLSVIRKLSESHQKVIRD